MGGVGYSRELWLQIAILISSALIVAFQVTLFVVLLTRADAIRQLSGRVAALEAASLRAAPQFQPQGKSAQ